MCFLCSASLARMAWSLILRISMGVSAISLSTSEENRDALLLLFLTNVQFLASPLTAGKGIAAQRVH